MVSDKDFPDVRKSSKQVGVVVELDALKQDRMGFECAGFLNEETLFALPIELDLCASPTPPLDKEFCSSW